MQLKKYDEILETEINEQSLKNEITNLIQSNCIKDSIIHNLQKQLNTENIEQIKNQNKESLYEIKNLSRFIENLQIQMKNFKIEPHTDMLK